MDIIAFSVQLETRMKAALEDLNPDQAELSKIAKALAILRDLINELKSFTRTYKFKNQTEEIQFFKEIKPVFLSQYFYYEEVFRIRMTWTFSDEKSKEIQYSKILRRLNRFLGRHRDFYQYCIADQNNKDHFYFKRPNQKPTSINEDSNFTTGYDTILARILANELIRKYINTIQEQSIVSPGGLIWTAPKTSLIELIYALHSAEVFNEGSVDIKTIATAFEACFNVNLGNYYRVIQDIKLRKTGQTNFLDQMKSSLVKRLNEVNN